VSGNAALPNDEYSYDPEEAPHPTPLPASGAREYRSGGFALIIVLWVLVLVAFIVAHLTASGRTEIRIAGNLVSNAVAEAAADGAITEAIFNLSDPNPEQRWPIDGNPREFAVGDSRVMVLLEDEAWRINPNSASPALLEALLHAIGADPESAYRVAIAIGEWVGSLAGARSQDAVLADYRAAGLDYGPPSAPFETLDELGRVLGVTPAMLAAMRPHLTLFGPAEPNPASPDPIVAAALAELPRIGPAAAPAIQQPPDISTVRITATAVAPGKARVRRVAIVRIGGAFPQGYAILARSSGFD
jgi:general secretion pathway protein K